jgi:tryptophanyl-tRNA synthetase
MTRSLSLVVPSGHLTLGNYLGAIRHWAAGQAHGSTGLFGVADLHALTIEHDPSEVSRVTREQALTLLAAGIDPDRSVVFVQSNVPAHTELHWLMEATAYDGELRRMIQYKEKSAKLGSVRAALLAYPVLMAADILLYGVSSVPVGEDQRQHLELARDLATRFNNTYGPTFVVPEAATPPVAARVMDLQDPTVKMNKSAPVSSRGVVRVLDPPDVIRSKVQRAQTDSGTDVMYDPQSRPGVSNLLEIFAACQGTTPDEAAATLGSYRELKVACADAVIDVLRPVQNSYAELDADAGYLKEVLAQGAETARDLALPILTRAKQVIGLYDSADA